MRAASAGFWLKNTCSATLSATLQASRWTCKLCCNKTETANSCDYCVYVGIFCLALPCFPKCVPSSSNSAMNATDGDTAENGTVGYEIFDSILGGRKVISNFRKNSSNCETKSNAGRYGEGNNDSNDSDGKEKEDHDGNGNDSKSWLSLGVFCSVFYIRTALLGVQIVKTLQNWRGWCSIVCN